VVRTGTMPNSTVTPRVSIQSDYLKSQASDYEIVITPQASLSAAGYVSQIEEASPVVRYIKAAPVTVVAGETDQTIEPSAGAFFDAVIVKAAQQPRLHAPTINVQSDSLYIYDNAQNGTFAQYFDIYADEIKVGETTRYATTVDMSTLGIYAGVWQIKVKARAENFIDSEFSNAQSYTKIGKLQTPGLIITEGQGIGGGTATVVPVDYAEGYTIKAQIDSETTTNITVQPNALTVNLDAYLSSGCYALSAIAEGDGVYLDSDPSEKKVYMNVGMFVFFIDDVAYYAGTGERWFVWVVDHNGFEIDGYGRVIKDGTKMVMGLDTPADQDDVINSSTQYTLVDI